MMETEILENMQEQEFVEDEFCHLRHKSCSSLLSLCRNAFKPYTHSNQLAAPGYYALAWGNVPCNFCGKPPCPDCMAVDYYGPCPNCGENR